MRWAIGIEYNGNTYNGWQIQPGLNNIQALLEYALSKVASTEIKIYGAGRTDSGVHAICQIAHFDTDVDRSEEAWVRGINSNLPDKIRVLWALKTNSDFNARRSAVTRRYGYLIYMNRVRPALLGELVSWVHYPLNIDNMLEASRYLIGELDYTAFRSSECQSNTSIRIVKNIEIITRNYYLAFYIEANSFLHHMIRNIMGSLLLVAKGSKSVLWFKNLISSKNRALGGPMFIPNGLYFMSVKYGEQYSDLNSLISQYYYRDILPA